MECSRLCKVTEPRSKGPQPISTVSGPAYHSAHGGRADLSLLLDGIARCCALAASGHAGLPPLRSAVSSASPTGAVRNSIVRLRGCPLRRSGPVGPSWLLICELRSTSPSGICAKFRPTGAPIWHENAYGNARKCCEVSLWLHEPERIWLWTSAISPSPIRQISHHQKAPGALYHDCLSPAAPTILLRFQQRCLDPSRSPSTNLASGLQFRRTFVPSPRPSGKWNAGWVENVFSCVFNHRVGPQSLSLDQVRGLQIQRPLIPVPLPPHHKIAN